MLSKEEKIKRQVEFYFGDSNYPKDKFLREKASLDADGFIDIDVLLSFNRMQALTDSVKDIAESVKDSDVVVLNDDKTKIKRKNPVPEVDDSMDRSVFVGGIAKDATLEDLEDFFGNVVKCIRMIRDKKAKSFLGMCYVELPSKEAAENFVKRDMQYKGENLKLALKATHLASLKEEREQKKKEKKSEQEREKAEKAAAKADEYTRGLIMKLEGVGEGASREDISENLSKFGEVKYVDFTRGDNAGYVRFATAEDASKALEGAKSDQFTVKGATPTVQLLEGDEEKEYWKKIYEASIEKRDRRGRKGARGGKAGRGGKGGRGGQRFSNKRGRDEAEGTNEKRQKTE